MNVEDKFKYWMANYAVSRKTGAPYHPSVPGDYATALRTWLTDPVFAALPVNNAFEVTQSDDFVAFKSAIENTPGYVNFNASHGAQRLGAALGVYGDFLVWMEAIMNYDKYLSAIRTKPFVLLAGISGTGKSRLVRQLARGCCPLGHDLSKDAAGKEADKPGNFEMIPVRPNWHDSTELLGYLTRITNDNKPRYVVTPFLKFLARAMVYKDVPFFLCLDEMNLAPVEQYFAEYLSKVETRKKEGNDIVTDVMVNLDLDDLDIEGVAKSIMREFLDENGIPVSQEASDAFDQIKRDKGLRIPQNLVVMGTVNMDETTCSFSRKVLDRAMTFELNDVSDMYAIGAGGNPQVPWGAFVMGEENRAKQDYVTAEDLYNEPDVATRNKNVTTGDEVLRVLKGVNDCLDATAFKIAYRSRNEVMLYCRERSLDRCDVAQALDEAISMKILSRIEGDDQKLAYVGDDPDYQDGTKFPTILEVLKDKIAKLLNDATCTVCDKKLDYMIKRLRGGFTNFFV